MRTKEERKQRRRLLVAHLRKFILDEDPGEGRAPDAEDIHAALALASAIGAWALSGFKRSHGAAIREALDALIEERADTPDDLRGLAEREQG